MEYIILGIDSIVFSTLYYFYKKKTRTLFNIQNAVELDLNNSSDKPSTIEYAMVVGRAKSDGLELTSHYNKEYKGVIRVLEIKEHGSNLSNNIKSDTTRIISRVVNDVPFSIIQEQKNSKPIKISIERPLDADYLFENLDLTFTKFEPVKDSFLSKFMSALISKESIHGVETTETMICNNKILTGFGKLEKIQAPPVSSIWLSNLTLKPEYRLSEPTAKGYSYILTPLSRSELVERLKSLTRGFKIGLIFFGSIGVALGIYCSYKAMSSYIQRKRREYQIHQAKLQRIRNQRARAQHYDNETNNIDISIDAQNSSNHLEQTSCVICLMNPRELVLLDCGHVCLCMDCLGKLNSPNCPICRERYRTWAPCYFP